MLDLSNLSQRICELTRDRILKRELVPGQSLSISEFAAQLGVSSTPVRDALKQLEVEGLVTIAPRRGCTVAVLHGRDVEELMEIRAIVECAAAEGAAATISDEQIDRLIGILRQLETLTEGERFADYSAAVEVDCGLHETIVGLLGNTRLSDLYSRLRVHGRMAPELYDPVHQRAQLDLEEHRRIVDTFVRRDASAAKRALVEHLERVKADALAHLARTEAAGCSSRRSGESAPGEPARRAVGPLRRARNTRRRPSLGGSVCAIE